MIVQNVFDQAIHLMDAQNESTGSTTTADTKEYALRTPNIINTLLDQVYPYSGTHPPNRKRLFPVWRMSWTWTPISAGTSSHLVLQGFC